ncbi:MAG TPA: hypothetical protein VI685_17330 [Candidatus Angelobacter sp.]
MNTNMNFPSILAFPGLAGALIGGLLAVAIIAVLFFARQRKAARIIAMLTGAGAVVYIVLLFGCSLVSKQKVLSRGQEKYFCEMDCHLAYSIVTVKEEPSGSAAKRYVVALKTRFDETTISSRRPKDVPLMPSPREIKLIDSSGRTFFPDSSSGVSLMQPLVPGESYITQLTFTIPAGTHDLKLLVRTVPGFPDQFVIGNENSLFHKKTYLALRSASTICFSVLLWETD